MLTTLIVSENKALGSLLKESLERLSGCEIKAELARPGLAHNLARQCKPDILVLDLEKEAESQLSLAQSLLAEYPQMTLLVTAKSLNSQLMLKAMRAGARDFFSQPFQEKELVTIFSRLSRQQAGQKKEAQTRNEIIAIFSNKGGVGGTSIAVNLAVNLARLTRGYICLVDLVLQHGDISTFLNLSPSYTIVEVVNNLARADTEFYKNTLSKHSSGIYVLAEPAKPEEADGITNSHISELLRGLKQTFDYVVVDAGHQFDARTISALDAADTILVVFLLDLPTIRSTIRCLGILRRLGYSQEKVRLVLNRYNPQDTIPLKEAEAALSYPIYWKLPNDFDSLITAINRGLPLLEVAEKSPLSQALFKLGEIISGKVALTEQGATAKKKLWNKKKLLSFLIRGEEKCL